MYKRSTADQLGNMHEYLILVRLLEIEISPGAESSKIFLVKALCFTLFLTGAKTLTSGMEVK